MYKVSAVNENTHYAITSQLLHHCMYVCQHTKGGVAVLARLK